jgi:hypothetical protein
MESFVIFLPYDILKTLLPVLKFAFEDRWKKSVDIQVED